MEEKDSIETASKEGVVPPTKAQNELTTAEKVIRRGPVVLGVLIEIFNVLNDALDNFRKY